MKLIDMIVKEVKRERINHNFPFFTQDPDSRELWSFAANPCLQETSDGFFWSLGDDADGDDENNLFTSPSFLAEDAGVSVIHLSDLLSAYDAAEKKDNELVEPEKLVDDNSFGESARYNRGGIECIDIMKAMTADKSGIEAICVSNVTKYLYRYKDKNGLVDVIKARNYLNKLIEEMESGKL